MGRGLEISDDLVLPLEFVTSTQAILAKKGVGKSYTASVESEELLKRGYQIGVIDPTGAWYGLKSSADGKSPGYSVVIIGGEHADIPLEESAGEVIANAVVDQRFSFIIDLSLLRKMAMNRFMAEFLEVLYHKNRKAMHLFVDEADLFAPQKPFKGQERTLGAMEDIVRRGRIRGIGCTLITQRSAVINKDVLTQVGLLTVMRLSHPRDIDPIREWVGVHGDEAEFKVMKESLPSLEKGTAWVWAPEWDLFEKIKIRLRETFDSGATPKPGETRRDPKVVAKIDLQSLGDQIKATIEKAKQDDPRELRKQIAQLKTQLANQKPATVAPPPPAVDIKALLDARLNAQSDNWSIAVMDFRKILEKRVMEVMLKTPMDAPARIRVPKVVRAKDYPSPSLPPLQPRAEKTPHTVFPKGGYETGVIPKGELAILIAAVQFSGVEKSELGVLTGYKRSARDTYTSRLTARGLVQIQGSKIYPTQSGIDALGSSYEPLPTGSDLLRYWESRLPKGEMAILNCLIDLNGDAVAKADLLNTVGYKRSALDTYISRLASKRLVESATPGTVKASASLFD